MFAPIFDAHPLTSYHILMSTKNPPCLNSDKVESATNLLRAFNHKHRFTIVTRLLAKGSMYPGQIASDLRLPEPYILEQLLILEKTGIVQTLDLVDGVKFVANKRVIRKVNQALQSFLYN